MGPVTYVIIYRCEPFVYYYMLIICIYIRFLYLCLLFSIPLFDRSVRGIIAK